MGMFKLDYIRRLPGIGDYNRIVDAVNLLIDKANNKKEVVPVQIVRKVKDYSFFLGNETKLPYKTNFILTDAEEAADVFWKYALTYKETAHINDVIVKWNIVALEIDVTEEISDKEKKQEAMFETVETTILDTEKPKRKTKKKKNSWN